MGKGGRNHLLIRPWHLSELTAVLWITNCSTSSLPWREDKELKLFLKRKKKGEGGGNSDKKINKTPGCPREHTVSKGFFFCTSSAFPVQLALLQRSGLILSWKQGTNDSRLKEHKPAELVRSLSVTMQMGQYSSYFCAFQLLISLWQSLCVQLSRPA